VGPVILGSSVLPYLQASGFEVILDINKIPASFYGPRGTGPIVLSASGLCSVIMAFCAAVFGVIQNV